MRIAPSSFVVIALATLVGCARYEFDLQRPTELAQHIGDKTPTSIELAPIRYQLQSAEGRLVMMIHNTDGQPITLRGDQSYVVAPSGQSHPLRTQTIAPGSYIKLILPPFRPRSDREGPVIGFGFGTVIGSANEPSPMPAGIGKTLTAPVYLRIDESDATYWEWEGQTEATISLKYDGPDGKTLTHAFTFKRVKV